MVVQRQLCFFKLATRPTADLSWQGCNNSFTVNLRNLNILPNYVTPIGGGAQIELYQPVFTVWGVLNRSFDGTEYPATAVKSFRIQQGYDDNQQTQQQQQVPQASIDSADSKSDNPTNTSDSMQLVFSDDAGNFGFVEGWYLLKAEGALGTENPGLVDLNGQDTFDNGQTKFSGLVLKNGTGWLVPIQKEPSKVQNLQGPDPGLNINDEAIFAWTIQGVGQTFCWIDDVAVANVKGKKTCESPYSWPLPDKANHTFRITMHDVCDNYVTDGLIFGEFGYVEDPKYVPPPPPPSADANAPSGGSPQPNGTIPPIAPRAKRNDTNSALHQQTCVL